MKLIRSLIRLARGFDMARFDLRYIHHNILFIKNLKKNSLIDCGPSGKIFYRKKSSWRQRWRIRHLLPYLFYGFLYDMRAPLGRAMRRSFQIRRRYAEEALNRLKATDRSSLALFDQAFWIRKKLVDQTRQWRSSALIDELQEALRGGVSPMPSLRGISGTWIMRNSAYKPIAVFKPFDEEVGAPYNPTKIDYQEPLGRSDGLFMGGSGFLRERAAYTISERLGFHLVPETVVARLKSPFFGGIRQKPEIAVEKFGSLQRFIPNAKSLEVPNTLEPSLLHPLFFLDMILGHHDRHLDNLLFDGQNIWAIDNGLSLFTGVMSYTRWAWMAMKQTRAPVDSALKEKLLSTRADQLLRGHKLGILVEERMRERLCLIHCGLKAGFTPYTIGSLMTRDNLLRLEGLNRTLYERGDEIIKRQKYEMEREAIWVWF